ncbi:hypothetical protein OsccyDRAFT_2431 [Leptolyngbyaceae cyanobacterium JSC-12]|nr:hypothetical protein OsccyDRAFT_2431 [Leptolyngbyaceae cyanobacterium JSC-12]
MMVRHVYQCALVAVVSLGAIAGIQVLSASAAQGEDMYGAIATDDETGSWGYAYNYPTRAQAEAEALKECGEQGCQVEVWFANACGAVAKDGNTVGWGRAESRAEAEAKALSACGTGACKVEVWACTDR